MKQIPFSPPDMSQVEIDAVAKVLRSGWITTGPNTKKFEREIAAYCGTERAVCLNSATACMELNLLILGAGSHGREVMELARSLNVFRKIGFLDDRETEALGPCRDFERWEEEWPCAVAAVGDWSVRKRWLEELAGAGFVLPVLIHPSATVSPSAELGYGTVVCARAVVGPGAKIGRGCIISGGAVIDRDAEVPEGTHIACGQTVGAGERLG